MGDIKEAEQQVQQIVSNDMVTAHADLSEELTPERMQALRNLKGLEYLRQPVPNKSICQLPKPTKNQTESLKLDASLGIRCTKCGGWHHKAVVHVDYVGHAAITSMLLTADPYWNWKPVAFGQLAAGELDKFGGMWIELTVCGMTRLGYGDAGGKPESADANKERIGDCIRNACMRFGGALELWHKGELSIEELEMPIGSETTSWTPQAKDSTAHAPDTSQAKSPAATEVDKSTGEIVPAGTATIPETEISPVTQAPAAMQSPPQNSGQNTTANSAIVSDGEAQFLRNKLNNQVESDVCKQFNVSSDTFAAATKTQWVEIKKFLTGK